jgi:hypothetical protein
VKKVLILLAIIGLLSVSVMFAHHGTNISYDGSKQFTITGTVTEFRYANPHAQLYFDVTNERGVVEHWSGEVGWSLGSMVRQGWGKKRSEDALKPGTKVTLLMAPARSGGPVGLIHKIFNEKGEQIFQTFGNPGGGERGGQ